MFDGLVMFTNAVLGYLTPTSLALAFGATLLGILAGCMPGLSATLVITLLTTLTLKMQPNQAILVLVCAYNGAIYGGSRTAILLNIPGTAANAAACSRCDFPAPPAPHNSTPFSCDVPLVSAVSAAMASLLAPATKLSNVGGSAGVRSRTSCSCCTVCRQSSWYTGDAT